MENVGNKRITFRVPPVMYARLEERARAHRIGVNDFIKLAISRATDDKPKGAAMAEIQHEALQRVLAEIAQTVVALQRRQDEIERLCASAVAAAALLLDSGTGPEAQAQERIKAHVRNSLSGAQAVLSIRNAAAAVGRTSN